MLAARLRRELERLAALAGTQAPAEAPRKFDLGLASAEAPEAKNIPWGYGYDRVTAMVVDPERLYVYWEVTDEAIERARTQLGPGGADAWMNLRVYDVTNRIFDGTNAHHHFDHSVSRSDRQWFFFIGRPSSTVVVEVGLKSAEGYFVRIARSGRTDFPRREPASVGSVEWLTVRSASGEVGERVTERREVPGAISTGARPSAQPELVRAWDIRRTHGGPDGEWLNRDESFGAGWEVGGEWAREWAIQWEGPLIQTAWHAGPFSYPAEPARYVEERYEGAATVRSVDGTVHVVHGARRVVIRGLGARAERRILAVWEVHHSWIVGAGVTARAMDGSASAPGSSEQVVAGASERRWGAASELRLGGASELYRLGASELLYLGASLWLQSGASEARYAGASERLHAGASEGAWPGASEHRPRYPAERVDPASPRA